MENPTLTLIDMKSFNAVHDMLKELTNKVDNVESKVNMMIPHESLTIPHAPDSFQVSLKELASILGVSKSTLKRWIEEGKKINEVILPQPHKREHNGYCYYKKSDLPKTLHHDVDRFYYDKTNASK